MTIKPGKYIHFEGNEYEAVGIAIHSQTFEELVLYRTSEKDEFWVCPTTTWNEIIDYNGHKVVRFTHIDDLLPCETEVVLSGTSSVISKHSTPTEKVQLFHSLFAGRSDVYAKLWERAKTGRRGYSPDCYNTWTSLCPKSNGTKVKCSECTAQRFKPFDEKAAENHLKGNLTVGAYPMFEDETCRFLAFDFDGKEYSKMS
ncbi:MAG: DUF1653 domain-containing protein [Firmicutes bacterium]|nr:DUF1653 domain-containing protein [Bacillota bacterium]